jgi:hypothetical protein
MEASEPTNPLEQPVEYGAGEAAQSAGSQKRGRLWLAVAFGALILGFAVFWVYLAAPYRPFPGDDGRLWGHMLQGKWLSVRDGFEPAAEISLRAFRWVGTRFVARSPGLLVASVAACYAGILGVLAWLAWRWSGHWTTALGAVLLFAVCAWPVSYLFFMSYAPLATWYACVGMGLLAFEPKSPLLRRVAIAGAALAGVAGVGCSISGGIALLGLGWIALSLRPALASRVNRVDVAVFFGVLLLGLGLLAALFGKDYYKHLTMNLGSEHRRDALAKFGAVPTVPVFSGLWILWTYSKAFAAAFVAGSLVVAVQWFRNSAPKGNAAPHPSLRPVAILGVAVWAELVAIQVLPTTKLARAHFIWFPGACLFVALACRWAVTQSRGRARWLARAAVALTLGISAVEGLGHSVEIRESRIALPRELETQHPDVKTIFVLDDDPHGRFLALWLRQVQVLRVQSLPNFRQLIAAPARPEVVLAVGPRGPGSGNSILTNGCMKDFSFPVDQFASQTGAEMKTLPYYAYNHYFCLEEEVCQGLLHQGRIPDPARDPDKNLRVLWWPARPETRAR